MAELQELHERLSDLEREVRQYTHLCAQVQDYQTKLLDIAEYWTQWMRNGEHLVTREATVLGLPTALERLLVEERDKQQQQLNRPHLPHDYPKRREEA